MGSVLFGRCHVLLRIGCDMYVQVKQRDIKCVIGYVCARQKSKNIHKYAENYDPELQSVWITAHR
jgi:hypothetical protein